MIRRPHANWLLAREDALMGHLDDDGLIRLLSAIVLQWWREYEDPHELAAFLEMPVEKVMTQRPQRIDGWRRKELERSC